MSVINNTTKSTDIDNALDLEMIANFNQEYDRLAEILGIVRPEVVAAGTALYQYKITGSLNSSTVAEGDEVPLSKYQCKKTPIGEVEIFPYRKLTTAQAVLKGGYVNAVVKTDKKMVQDVRADILGKFFTFLATGTGSATGETLQAALAFADAELEDTMEDNGDHAENIIHFVNRQDIAEHLAKAEVTVQSVFGMNYIQNFLGVNNIFTTNKVPQGTLYAVPADNIHIYGVDFATLGSAGLAYTAQDGSLIGVNHEAAYDRVSAVTNVLSGANMIAEITDYIVAASINPS